MKIKNPHAADEQDLKLLDYDVTDLEGDKDITKYLYPAIPVAPKEYIVLNKGDLLGYLFRYGIAGYVTTSNGLEVYVAGVFVRYDPK